MKFKWKSAAAYFFILLPVWNVYQYDVNSQTFKLYNVYSHRGFLKDLVEMKDIEDIDEYAEKLRRSIMYHFWGKCEYEILIAEWPYDEEKGPCPVPAGDPEEWSS